MFLLMIGAVFFFPGCSDNAVKEDSTPFKNAISKYLSQKHMDMKVYKFKKLEVNGDKAKAVCSMKEASGMSAGIAVQWNFSFEKKDGAWIVTGRN